MGLPIFDDYLCAGDLLYFPRGTIHVGVTSEDSAASLHLTVSTYHKSSWADFIQLAVPQTIEKLTLDIMDDEDGEGAVVVALKEGLPVNWAKYFGKAVLPFKSPASN